ncbi:hypothetical protein I3842_01G154100 [Carya illinoinensis]|uniref:Major facilitator superfamily (MFS) profile domain-containing protein n=1 Tax=Carya illinoinensis TaxID=32201 RepID=A0A922G3U8_CARIL|nr:hypothetical protein I3842_01G154100 [Carya illinoinensis]
MAIGQYNHADNGQVNGFEDLEKPFIRQEKDVGYGNNNPDKSVESGSIGMVLLSTFVAVSGSFEFGSCYSMFGSILTIGAMLGAVTSGRIADFIGRKGAMRMSAGFCIAGWLAVYFSKGAFPLDMGRLFTGYGIGVFSYVVPIFIAEIAPKNLRGGLTTLNQLMIVIGSSVAFLMGTVMTWRTLALTGLVPCIFLLVGLCFVPESPRWLAKVGHEKEFEVALQRLRGKDADITCEASEILDNIKTLQTLQKVKLMDLFQSKHIRPVTIGIALMIFQQFGGINGISFYASETFASAGLSSTKIGIIAYACVQVPITVVGAILMDKSGRRPLIMISATGTFLGCFLAGTSFVLKSHGLLPEWVAILAVGGVLIYIASFSIGMGAVPWVIMSEVTFYIFKVQQRFPKN